MTLYRARIPQESKHPWGLKISESWLRIMGQDVHRDFLVLKGHGETWTLFPYLEMNPHSYETGFRIVRGESLMDWHLNRSEMDEVWLTEGKFKYGGGSCHHARPASFSSNSKRSLQKFLDTFKMSWEIEEIKPYPRENLKGGPLYQGHGAYTMRRREALHRLLEEGFTIRCHLEQNGGQGTAFNEEFDQKSKARLKEISAILDQALVGVED